MKFDIPEMPVKYIDGKRYYVTPEGVKYPSITTILACDPEKQKILEKWRERVGEKEADRISRVASQRGTSMHEMCEHYLDGEEDYSIGHMPDAQALFHSIREDLDDIDEVWAQETPLYSNHLKAAGRVDLIGKYKGTPSIIDFKTSGKPKQKSWITDYFIQCAVYAVMFEEMTGAPIPQIVIIMAIEGGLSQVYVERRNKYIGGYFKLRKEYDNQNGIVA